MFLAFLTFARGLAKASTPPTYVPPAGGAVLLESGDLLLLESGDNLLLEA